MNLSSYFTLTLWNNKTVGFQFGTSWLPKKFHSFRIRLQVQRNICSEVKCITYLVPRWVKFLFQRQVVLHYTTSHIITKNLTTYLPSSSSMFGRSGESRMSIAGDIKLCSSFWGLNIIFWQLVWYVLSSEYWHLGKSLVFLLLPPQPVITYPQNLLHNYIFPREKGIILALLTNLLTNGYC